MTRKYNFIAICLLLLFPALAAEAEGPDVRSVVETVINAHGGREAVASMKSLYAKGFISASMRKDSGVYERWYRRPGDLFVLISYSREHEVRLVTGGRGFRGDSPETLKEVSGPRLDAMLYQANAIDIVHMLMTEIANVRYEGIRSENGREGILLSFGHEFQGPSMQVLVDARSGLIIRTVGFFSVGGTNAWLAADYSDYRPVGPQKLMLPWRIANQSTGMHIGDTVIESFEINQSMPDERFALPSPKQQDTAQ